MEIEIKKLEKYTTVVLTGALDLYNVGTLKKQMQTILEGEEVKYLVLDLKSVEYMDSSGIALIAHMRKKMLAKSGKFVLLHVGDGVIQVMKLAALDQFFTFAKAESEL